MSYNILILLLKNSIYPKKHKNIIKRYKNKKLRIAFKIMSFRNSQASNIFDTKISSYYNKEGINYEISR